MSLWVLLSLILFIETTVAVYRPVSAFYSGIFPMIVMALALLAIGIKLLRVFLYKPLSVMYIAFYWLTVEVLPIVGVWYSAKEIL